MGEKHVVWLDVSVDNSSLVEIFQCQNTLSKVEDGVVLLQISVHRQERLEVPANHVLHHQEHVVDGLQTVEETHYERTLGDGKGISLSSDLKTRK